LLVLLVLAALIWTGWAAASFYDLRNGLQNADAVALERRIDWLRLRDGLREDLLAGRATGGATPQPPRIDAMLGRPAVAHLLRTAALDETGWAAPQAGAKAKDVFGWYRIRSAWFSGGPFAFQVEISPDSGRLKRPFILLFQWTGDWRLTHIFLPADAGRSAAAARTPTSDPDAPPPDAQRAVLFEEDAAEANGKRSIGWVAWRLEPSSAGAGDKAGPAIVAEVRIPGRSLGLTMTIRRNLDRSLPASHTIELNFALPPDRTARGIADLAAIQMKSDEAAAGQPLAGSRVKVDNEMFLVGLSAVDADVRNNVQMLKERSWIGVLFVSDSNNRAVLSIEKGETGGKVIADALAQWRTAPVTGDTSAR
jgi:hypothetical protein